MNNQADGNVEMSGGKITGAVTGQNSGTINNYYGVTPASTPPDERAEAAATLANLPLDTIPARAPLPRGSRMPQHHNALFVGRDHSLRTLARALKDGATLAIATGIGGVGKTALAIEFAHCYGQFFAGGVFWLSFANRDTVAAEIAACGGAGFLELAENYADLDLADQINLVKAHWLRDIPTLLVFDNCEDADLLRWRPPSGAARVLITSRRTHWDATLGVQQLHLHPLDPQPSRELLRGHLHALNPPAADLDALAHELGYLPLALNLAGRSMAYLGVPPADYLAELRAAPLLEHESLSDNRDERNLERVFGLSYDRLRPDDAVDALALKLLARAACFAPGEPIPRDLLAHSVEADPRTLRKAIARLSKDLGLIEGHDPCKLHRLIAAFVQQRTPDPDAHAAVERTLISYAYKINMSGIPTPLLPLRAHLSYVTDRALQRGDERAATLAINLAYHLDAIGDYGAARPLYERALAIKEQQLGPTHPDTATSLNNLAGLLRAQGDYAAARPLYERALAIKEQQLGPDHPDTATSLNNLALLLDSIGDYAAARPLLERALAIREQQLGPSHPDVATSLNNLAGLLRAQGDYGTARPLYERALAIDEAVYGPDHPEVATNLNNLAALLDSQGDDAAARPLYERALAITEQQLGPTHPDTATSLNNLAGLYYAQGDYAAARPLYERALAIREQQLGPHHPNVAASLNNLAALLKALGDDAAARPLYERALAIREQQLGPTHPDTAQSLNNLAWLHYDEGDVAGGILLMQRAVAICEQVLGPLHPDTQGSRRSLETMMQAAGGQPRSQEEQGNDE